MGSLVIVQRQPDLLEIVFALRHPRRFTSLLHRGEQNGNENGDDRDHDQQFNRLFHDYVL